LQQKLSAFDTQASKWGIDASNQEKTLMRNVDALYAEVSDFRKDTPKMFTLVKRDGKYYAVKNNSKDFYKFTADEKIGNLDALFNKYHNPEFKDMNFAERQKAIARQKDKEAKEKQKI
jgi:hypothetical protein